MLNQQPLELIPLAKSWLSPTLLHNVTGCTGAYDKEERAYILIKEADQMSMTLLASEDHPVENLCLVVKNWNSNEIANILLDDNPILAKQGIVRDIDGSKKLVVWIEKTTKEAFNLVIRKD